MAVLDRQKAKVSNALKRVETFTKDKITRVKRVLIKPQL